MLLNGGEIDFYKKSLANSKTLSLVSQFVLFPELYSNPRGISLPISPPDFLIGHPKMN